MACSDVWLDFEKYKVNLTNKLGQGTFGIVYKGKDKKKGCHVAVKEVKLTSDKTGGDAMVEIKNLMKLPAHDNVVQFLDFNFSRNAIWMVMEFCDLNDLVAYYQKFKPIPIETNVSFMCQIASAIAHMHSLPEPIVHRDLKPANIMLKYGESRPIIKITDFGMAKVADDKMDLAKTFMMTTIGGTPGFMAPEFFAKERYTASVDVFAMGLVMLGMLTYEENKDMLPMPKQSVMPMPIGMLMQLSLQQNTPPPEIVEMLPSDGALTKSLKELFLKMISVKPCDRIRAKDVVETLGALFAPLADRLPSPPPRPSPDSDADTRSTSSDSSGSSSPTGLGYHLLRQAAEQHFADQLREDGQTDLGQAALRELEKGMPLLEMLLRQALDSDTVQDEAKAREGKSSSDELEQGDRVIIDDCGGDISKAMQLQKNYGGWTNRMKDYLGEQGVVHKKILHIVKVRFDDGASWSFNPALVKKLGADGHAVASGGNSRRNQDFGDVVRGLFRRFDVVKIPEDQGVVQLLQKGHGGWNDRMKLSLGIKAIVNRVDKDGDVFVECINGDDWVLNPELLTKVEITGDEELEPGDFVVVRDDENELKRLHEGNGGWCSEMSQALGHTAIVKEVLSGDKISLECRQTLLTFHVKAVKLVAKADEMLVALLRRKMKT